MKEENKTIAPPAGVTPEQIKAWKDRYGENSVKLASLPKDDDGSEFFDAVVRVPDRKTISEFEKWVDKNPDKAKEVMVNACVLSGKDAIKADDGLFLGAFDAIVKLMPIRSAIIKNL